MKTSAHPFDRVPKLMWIVGCLTMLLLLAAVTPAPAADVDLRAGIYTDPDAVSFGAGLLTPMSGSSPWYFNPNAEFAFGDFRDVISFNADFHYDFDVNRSNTFWLGLGPALLINDYDRGGNDVDLGINMLAGFGATHGSVRPYGQLKGTVSDDSRVALAGGIRF